MMVEQRELAAKITVLFSREKKQEIKIWDQA